METSFNITIVVGDNQPLRIFFMEALSCHSGDACMHCEKPFYSRLGNFYMWLMAPAKSLAKCAGV